MALQAIARRNRGTRAVGTAGYSQSVAYVVRKLRAVGYRPRLQTFSFDFFRETKPPVLERVKPASSALQEGARLHRHALLGRREPHGAGRPGSISPRLRAGARPRTSRGFPNGAVALMKRGECPFSQKAANAQGAGAAAALIANDGTPGRTAPISATLFAPVKIPVLVVSSAVAADLAPSSTVHIELSVSTRTARAVERDRRPARSAERSGAARRAPRFGRERAGNQRQRLRLGARPRGRAAGPAAARAAHARAAVRVLGRRGARASSAPGATCRA